jgi:type IV secretion system protein TrbI
MSNEENTGVENPDAENAENENEPSFELTPEQATGFDEAAEAPGRFNRKRAMIAIAVTLAVFIGGGLLYNTLRPNKKTAKTDAEVTAGDSSSSFLSSLRDRAANRREPPPEEPPQPQPDPEPTLPPVTFNRSPQVEEIRNYPPPSPPVPQYNTTGNTAPAPQGPDMTPVYRSALVPPVEGSLFSSGYRAQQQPAPPQQTGYNAADDYYQNALAAQNAAQNAARNPYGSQVSDYVSQNDQANKQAFYDSSYNGGMLAGGRFLGENSVWIGTILPGILETAVNTDLPGNVLARVTRNIYDSLTGRKLLIPQGTILIAKYNSSVSYAQRRVQIVWDTLIRPDGFQLDLAGMNSVDKSGMSGQEAEYHENWFEYLKAAGIITLFSLANASMTDTAAKYAQDASASAVANANNQMVNQLGGNMVSRAMNIQPTLTVKNGTLVNIMCNQTLYLPPVGGFPFVRR